MKELIEALAKAQGELKNATLNKINPHFKSKYADLAGIRDAVAPVLAKHGIALTQTVTSMDGTFFVNTTLWKGGEKIESLCPIMCAAGAGAQQFGSAMTYARRYSMAAIVGIAAEEDDDANAAQDAKPQQRTTATATKTQNQPPADPFAGNDWVSWGENFVTAIKACSSVDEARDEFASRSTELAAMKAEAPAVYARFYKLAQDAGKALADQAQAAE